MIQLGARHTLNDYLKGAFEALSWVRSILKDEKDINAIIKQVDDAIADVTEGVAVDFRRRLKPIRS